MTALEQSSASTNGRPYRLLHVVSHPIQYFVPLYRRLEEDSRVELTVLFCSREAAGGYLDPGFGREIEWDVPMLGGYRHRFLRNVGRGGSAKVLGLVNPGVVPAILFGRYDAVWVHGYNHPTHLLAILAARARRTPVLYRGEASLYYDSVVRRPLVVRVLKRPLLSGLFRLVSGFLAIGGRNRDFYLANGAPPERIFSVPYTVDNERFSRQAEEARSRREEFRARYGIGDEVAFLFAGKLIRAKGLPMLLRAYRELGHRPRALLVAGEGEHRAEVERYVADHALPGVHFLGFVNQTELPEVYAAADVLVRPDEPHKGDWGLGINEAMVSGLAVVTSVVAAGGIELIEQGESGYILPAGDEPALVEALSVLADDAERTRAMGRRAAERMETWGIPETAAGILDALASVTGRSVRVA